MFQNTQIVDEKIVKELEEKARQIRCDIVEMIGIGNAGHIGGSNSSADLVTALYFYKMNHDPKCPDRPDRDRFLLSKGHAAIVQYAALAECGYFPKEELYKLKSLGAMLQGHPDVQKTPGIEAGTGSLGQGLSIGVGMALGLRKNGIDSKVYVIIGDGEMAEGQIWEAVMAAANYHLNHLVVILDRNQIQATGPIVDRFDTNPIRPKWEGFGFLVLETDGHNMANILEVLEQAEQSEDKPVLIIANTIKGKGISFAENTAAYHNGTLTQETYDLALFELKASELNV